MDEDQLVAAAIEELNLIMQFFPRVDSKLAFVFALDLGMLALLAANAPKLDPNSPSQFFALVPVLVLGASLWYVYRGSYPNTVGGHQSLIYFREIALRTESGFAREFSSQSRGAYVSALLEQIHRNSAILARKYDAAKAAFVLTGVAVIPWLISLLLFVTHSADLRLHTS
jgi:hypothetical protein